MSPPLRLATRKSPLAQRQAAIIAEALAKVGALTEIRTFSTDGDEIDDRPLAEVGGKELFVNRLRRALLADEADFAVHSLKDMAAAETPTFNLAVGFAEDPRDAMILPPSSLPAADLSALPAGLRVGTCSPRRAALLAEYAPHLSAVFMRGNIQTRHNKLLSGACDVLLLAAAGLHRLDLAGLISAYLPAQLFIPAPGQGILAMECLAARADICRWLSLINNERDLCRARAERAFAAAIGGDCHTPLGAFAEVLAEEVCLRAFYAGDDGGFRAGEFFAPRKNPELAGQKAAATLKIV